MTSRTLRIFPLAYHFSLQAYGRWLPGDPRGWHRHGDGAGAPPRAGDEIIRALSRERQRHPTATITEPTRAPIVHAVRSIALDRGWRIHEIATTHSHLHVVLTAPVKGIEILKVLRAESRRELVEGGLIEPSDPFWSAGGYFSMIHTARGLEWACEYVARHRDETGTGDVGERHGAPRR